LPDFSEILYEEAVFHRISVIGHIIRVYFRPLRKGVVLPLAIVIKGVELPLEHIKKGSYSYISGPIIDTTN